LNATRIIDTEESRISEGGGLAGDAAAVGLAVRSAMAKNRNLFAAFIGFLPIKGPRLKYGLFLT
jgi:hypothetical protein